MIRFLLTNWWIYVPIIAVLLFLTARNNRQIKQVKLQRELESLDPETRQKRIEELKRQSRNRKRSGLAAKYGLSGVLNHILGKK